MTASLSAFVGIHDGDPSLTINRLDSGTINMRFGEFGLLLMAGHPDETGALPPDRALDAIAQSIREFKVSELPAEPEAACRPVRAA